MFTRTALLAFAAIAAAAPNVDAEPVHISAGRQSLEPRADGTADMAAFFRELNKTLKKYNASSIPFPLNISGASLFGLDNDDLVKRKTKDLSLTDLDSDVMYYGEGTVSGQSFNIDFDTGSADFLVPGPHCNGCRGTPYDQKGKNQHRTTSISSMLKGHNYFDTVCVAKLCAGKTNLVSLTDAQGFLTSGANSLMGMAFSSVSKSNEPTFFERLMALGKVSKNEFSFYLGRRKSGTAGKSQMTLGGRDPSKFTGTVKSHKLTTKGYWQIHLDGSSVGGGKPIKGTKGQAAIDTGSAVIVGSKRGISNLFRKVDKALISRSDGEDLFVIPCNSKQSISLVFGGVKYAINPLDLNLGSVGTQSGIKYCLTPLVGADVGQSFYVVGDAFLKNWYSIFSYNKGGSVSFAKAKGNH